MDPRVIESLIGDFHERELPELVEREVALTRLSGRASAVVGMRRAGKTFRCYQVPIHSRSVKARQVNPKKVYAVDCGLLQGASIRLAEDRGALLENLAFLHLHRGGLEPEYYVTKSGYEIDFVVGGDGRADRQLIQVCWQLDDEATKDREVRGVREAMGELHASDATIVTWLEEREVDEAVRVVPAWRWLLEERGHFRARP